MPGEIGGRAEDGESEQALPFPKVVGDDADRCKAEL